MIRAALAAALVISIALGFGMSGKELARLDAFNDAVHRWQVNPDYRAVQREYVRLGSAAMQGRWWGVPAGSVVMAFRSIPGLSQTLAANPGSESHYKDFTEGPLSAYLHLTGEQGLEMGEDLVEQLGKTSTPSDADIVRFLGSFNLPIRVVTDTGAIAGARRLLVDIDAARPLRRRGTLATALTPHISAIARLLDFPSGPHLMTFNQQSEVLQKLDDTVRRDDPELWRSKQVSDFLGGIWAQGYGQIYRESIAWFYRLRWGGRSGLGCILFTYLAIVLARRSRARRTAAQAPAKRD